MKEGPLIILNRGTSFICLRDESLPQEPTTNRDNLCVGFHVEQVVRPLISMASQSLSWQVYGLFSREYASFELSALSDALSSGVCDFLRQCEERRCLTRNRSDSSGMRAFTAEVSSTCLFIQGPGLRMLFR